MYVCIFNQKAFKAPYIFYYTLHNVFQNDNFKYLII